MLIVIKMVFGWVDLCREPVWLLFFLNVGQSKVLPRPEKLDWQANFGSLNGIKGRRSGPDSIHREMQRIAIKYLVQSIFLREDWTGGEKRANRTLWSSSSRRRSAGCVAQRLAECQSTVWFQKAVDDVKVNVSSHTFILIYLERLDAKVQEISNIISCNEDKSSKTRLMKKNNVSSDWKS